jgi:transposase
MSEGMEELTRRLVVGHKRDGRAVYDEQAKAELVAMCAARGASVSRLARECGVNANQLSRWVRESAERQQRALAVASEPPAAAFVPVTMQVQLPSPAEPSLCLQARLPNGVVVDLRGCDFEQAGQLIDALGRLRCSASTKG